MKVVDKRYFCDHSLWQDYCTGCYEIGYDIDLIVKSVEVLSNQELFWDVMCQMKLDWKESFLVNLSNRTINRRAYLGQSSCCYNHGAQFNLTIKAWSLLSAETQTEANKTATKMIELFEREEDAKNTDWKKYTGRCERTDSLDF